MDYGMSRLGRVTYREDRQSRYLNGGDDIMRERTHSEQTAREIDQEIHRIIDQALDSVRHILETRRKALVALAERLIEKETVDTAELKMVIEANSPSPMIVPGTAASAGEAAKRRHADGKLRDRLSRRSRRRSRRVELARISRQR